MKEGIKVKLLILGGTRFLGLHIVKEAVKRGHEVTIFHRGLTDHEEIPKQVEKLQGDRDGDLIALQDRKWDAVIDTCGYIPRIVKSSAELLSSSTDLYVFISSISVYGDFSKPDMKENSTVGTIEDKTIEEVTSETYGPLKVLCEQEVLNLFPEGSLIIRPGLIVGPEDYTERFTYWPRRISRGGEILAPGNPNAKIQFIDVRDLANFILIQTERKRQGTYNVTGPKEHLTFEAFLQCCKDSLNSQAEITWVDDDFLQEQQIGQWIELPLYISAKENMSGMLDVNIEKALHEGLTFMSLEETIKDTFEWDLKQPKDRKKKAGLEEEKEMEALKQWNHKRLN